MSIVNQIDRRQEKAHVPHDLSEHERIEAQFTIFRLKNRFGLEIKGDEYA